ncbi:hypothetical protein HNY73_014228 [Argiope bruennichi]|uniref:Uncharacterized protein n=1 Tax=Argiope bruennichi TaxID=94029 RepID=A0A8T0ETL7_ARGBR|nr:hypothetical protein HNY73_014228 [Argiope bruennichi]
MSDHFSWIPASVYIRRNENASAKYIGELRVQLSYVEVGRTPTTRCTPPQAAPVVAADKAPSAAPGAPLSPSQAVPDEAPLSPPPQVPPQARQPRVPNIRALDPTLKSRAFKDLNIRYYNTYFQNEVFTE